MISSDERCFSSNQIGILFNLPFFRTVFIIGLWYINSKTYDYENKSTFSYSYDKFKLI